MSSADRHPGDRLAALADGRLAEPERSRVLDHLVRCAGCRADYDAQLAMKGLLRGLDEPGAPVDLRVRLSGLASAPAAASPPARPRRSPASWAPRSTTSRIGAAGVALMSLSTVALAGGYALGGSGGAASVTPPLDRFVREHAAVSGGLPLTEPVLWQLPTGSTASDVPPGRASSTASTASTSSTTSTTTTTSTTSTASRPATGASAAGTASTAAMTTRTGAAATGAPAGSLAPGPSTP